MPRAIVYLLISVAALSGCVSPPPIESTEPQTVNPVSQSSVEEWLDQLEAVEAMDSTEVKKALEQFDKPGSASQLFYYGVLNQSLRNYGAWTVARDAFKKLQEDLTLSKQQRQLAGVLRQYNQSRINSQSRYNTLLNEQVELREGLNRTESEKRQLEQKIQALTELETTISTRQKE